MGSCHRGAADRAEHRQAEIGDVAERRAQQADIEAQQLAIENSRRQAKGEALLNKIKEEDEDALPVEDEKTKPEDDAYLAESGRILLDYLGLNTRLAKQ